MIHPTRQCPQKHILKLSTKDVVFSWYHCLIIHGRMYIFAIKMLFNCDLQELMEILEQMRQRLIEEKRKHLLLEVKIREEVCQEMATQLVEIENHYR